MSSNFINNIDIPIAIQKNIKKNIKNASQASKLLVGNHLNINEKTDDIKNVVTKNKKCLNKKRILMIEYSENINFDKTDMINEKPEICRIVANGKLVPPRAKIDECSSKLKLLTENIFPINVNTIIVKVKIVENSFKKAIK